MAARSENSVTGAEQVATPESASAHVNVTVTSVLFHPAAFGVGDTCAEIVGGVKSVVIWYVHVPMSLGCQSGLNARAFRVTRPMGSNNGAVYTGEFDDGSLPSSV